MDLTEYIIVNDQNNVSHCLARLTHKSYYSTSVCSVAFIFCAVRIFSKI